MNPICHFHHSACSRLYQALLRRYLTEQKVFTKSNQPPPPAVDVKRVKEFEHNHTGPPAINSVQMDWPLPFSSAWNAAAIHVLARGFWDLHRDAALKEIGLAFDDVKALCICKLERTRREYNDAQNADLMDTGDDGERSTKAAVNRRYTRKLGVGCSLSALVCRVLMDQYIDFQPSRTDHRRLSGPQSSLLGRSRSHFGHAWLWGNEHR
jgi:hypothetical protein